MSAFLYVEDIHSQKGHFILRTTVEHRKSDRTAKMSFHMQDILRSLAQTKYENIYRIFLRNVVSALVERTVSVNIFLLAIVLWILPVFLC